ncbi:hypothetical protein M409DRAFT_50209 [Zasmidium cellare ATCC 36951]|uniref:Uncharacterized protein n=1 Tax=Zasmidium cellare ATCC 36951 TaxID=1080233 RepID=A0A6A6D016_ZASCE|nr:uncharacterized protein M409DRAFT_50209 [Zasmidium cellare ATCC 36951]KAF2172525.1 hypothetical protein M409DRAFT_50209 [Zasmidium cellare ATCC 36951]
MAQACQGRGRRRRADEDAAGAAMRSALASDTQRGAVRDRNVHLWSENKRTCGWEWSAREADSVVDERTRREVGSQRAQRGLSWGHSHRDVRIWLEAEGAAGVRGAGSTSRSDGGDDVWDGSQVSGSVGEGWAAVVVCVWVGGRVATAEREWASVTLARAAGQSVNGRSRQTDRAARWWRYWSEVRAERYGGLQTDCSSWREWTVESLGSATRRRVECRVVEARVRSVSLANSTVNLGARSAARRTQKQRQPGFGRNERLSSHVDDRTLLALCRASLCRPVPCMSLEPSPDLCLGATLPACLPAAVKPDGSVSLARRRRAVRWMIWGDGGVGGCQWVVVVTTGEERQSNATSILAAAPSTTYDYYHAAAAAWTSAWDCRFGGGISNRKH